MIKLLYVLGGLLALAGWELAGHPPPPESAAATWPWGAGPDVVDTRATGTSTAGTSTVGAVPTGTVLPGTTPTGASAAARPVGPTDASGAAAVCWRIQARGHIPMPAGTPAAHASALLPAAQAGAAEPLWAFWFAGTRESAADVGIAAAAWDARAQRWGPARWVVQRADLAAQLGWSVRRIGNPVAWRDASGHTHLAVVGTGLGGWAAARIIHLREPAESAAAADLAHLRWQAQRALPLGWWWNTSHLVRTGALALVDGGVWLPAYAELGRKWPWALRFDAQGHWQGLQVLSTRAHLLQPALIATGPTRWQALMRTQHLPGRVAQARTDDAGAHWRDGADLPLSNPDASVAALSLAPGVHLLAFNPTERGRHRLDLAGAGADGVWRVLHTLAIGEPGAEYSYPALAWADTSAWVSYTDQRQRIAWVRLGACRTWGVDSENRPQRAQFSSDLQAHSRTMGQEAGEKWAAAIDSQPTLPKPDRLLVPDRGAP